MVWAIPILGFRKCLAQQEQVRTVESVGPFLVLCLAVCSLLRIVGREREKKRRGLARKNTQNSFSWYAQSVRAKHRRLDHLHKPEIYSSQSQSLGNMGSKKKQIYGKDCSLLQRWDLSLGPHTADGQDSCTEPIYESTNSSHKGSIFLT